MAAEYVEAFEALLDGEDRALARHPSLVPVLGPAIGPEIGLELPAPLAAGLISARPA
jgi:hypothetical protein